MNIHPRQKSLRCIQISDLQKSSKIDLLRAVEFGYGKAKRNVLWLAMHHPLWRRQGRRGGRKDKGGMKDMKRGQRSRLGLDASKNWSWQFFTPLTSSVTLEGVSSLLWISVYSTENKNDNILQGMEWDLHIRALETMYPQRPIQCVNSTSVSVTVHGWEEKSFFFSL